MLSCKEFVERSARILENEEISLHDSMSNKLHLFFCHHCRSYLTQAKITVAVAKKLDNEPAPEPVVDKTVTEMKKFSVSEQ